MTKLLYVFYLFVKFDVLLLLHSITIIRQALCILCMSCNVMICSKVISDIRSVFLILPTLYLSQFMTSVEQCGGARAGTDPVWDEVVR